MLSLAFLRRRWSRKAIIAKILRMVHPPIVPPTMAPRLGFAGSVEGVSVGVGVLDGVTRTVVVRYNSAGTELTPHDLAADAVKPLFVHPCCVMLVLLYWMMYL